MTADMSSTAADLVLREESYDSPVAQQLIDAVQLEYVARYGGPDAGPVESTQFTPPNGRFVIGYIDCQPVASGGYRLIEPDVVEIKRMYVVPSHRRRGLSRVMLAHLEDLARRDGAVRVLLETGHAQPEAIALYESSGYERVEGFGHYACQPGSFSFGKKL
jgi:GNAT superfamily N-acetyltransferase